MYNSVTGVVVADAIRVVKTDKPFTPTVPDIILDTAQANYIGTWNEGSTVGWYGSGYRANYNGNGSDTATWIFNIEHAGLWEVYVWWVEDFNRATNAPYTINATDSVTVRVDQKQNGSRWVSLGQYEFQVGPASIVLSDDADGYVIADAIELVYIQPQ